MTADLDPMDLTPLFLFAVTTVISVGVLLVIYSRICRASLADDDFINAFADGEWLTADEVQSRIAASKGISTVPFRKHVSVIDVHTGLERLEHDGRFVGRTSQRKEWRLKP
jgi:hypothetical protein